MKKQCERSLKVEYFQMISVSGFASGAEMPKSSPTPHLRFMRQQSRDGVLYLARVVFMKIWVGRCG